MKFGSNVCPVCNEIVYFAEELRAAGRSFHRLCFKCVLCNKALDSFTVNEHNGKLYCRKCCGRINNLQGNRLLSVSGGNSPCLNRRSRSQGRIPSAVSPARHQSRGSNGCLENGYHASRFGSVGRIYSPYWDDTSGSQYRPSRPRWINSAVGGVRCANCTDLVFANERIDAVGKAFHRLCFKCASCRRLLDRGTVCDHNREIFCQKCYTKNFGSVGFKAGTHLRCE